MTDRVVGVCAYCQGDVVLTADRTGGRREASCPCGATVIKPSLFALLGGRVREAVGR